jgi:glycosyltransferase involved in cell wall biosynthesis
MKYPNILFFRYEKYAKIDVFFKKNEQELLCNINIIDNKLEINKLFDPSYHLILTYGLDNEYNTDVNDIIPPEMRKRWLHFNSIDDLERFNNGVNFCYHHYLAINNNENKRPTFSIFTTCYKSYEKIFRAYNSLLKQELKFWEWVVIDDSPEDDHFNFLKSVLDKDKRVRLYKRSENSGNIGNVKNEAVSLCRGKYVLELDHDDEILPDLLKDATKVFDDNDDIGFIYADFSNIYENWENFNYGNFFGLGYEGYYMQKYNNRWIFVCSTANINNITLSHNVSVPNHPRIWRKKTLLEIGNFNELMPISDDYELLLRTSVSTKIAKIHKLGYIQYMNTNNNNFSLIRNGEINRLVHHLKGHLYNSYNISEVMDKLDASENIEFRETHSKIWKRENFEHKFCNRIVNVNFKKQYCIIGLDTLTNNLIEIVELYRDASNDFILLDNKYGSNDNILCKELDKLQLDRMKCYSMDDCTEEELIRYFHLIYKSTEEFYIYQREIN